MSAFKFKKYYLNREDICSVLISSLSRTYEESDTVFGESSKYFNTVIVTKHSLGSCSKDLVIKELEQLKKEGVIELKEDPFTTDEEYCGLIHALPISLRYQGKQG